MDLLRSCYRSKMRLFSDRPDVQVQGQWYFCPEGAKPIPFLHSFGSAQWDDYRVRGNPALGETRSRGAWVAGLPPAGLDGHHFCGHADVWRDGVPYSERGDLPTDADGVPLCCSRAVFLDAAIDVQAVMEPRLVLRAELLLSAALDTGIYINAGVEVRAVLQPRITLVAELYVSAALGAVAKLRAILVVDAFLGRRFTLFAEIEVGATLGKGFAFQADLVLEAALVPVGPDTVATACCPIVPMDLKLEVDGFELYPWVNGTFAFIYQGFGLWITPTFDHDGFPLLWEFLCFGPADPPMGGWRLRLFTFVSGEESVIWASGFTDLSSAFSCSDFSVGIMLSVIVEDDVPVPEVESHVVRVSGT